MRKLLFGSVALTAISFASPALSNDGPARSWTGFYAGLNAGGAMARNQTADAQIWNPATPFPPGFIFPIIGDDSFSHGQIGGIFGAQLGFNWQLAPTWVAGFEADWQLLRQNENACISACLPAAGFVTLLYVTDEQSMPWLATARGRLGWVAPNGALIYGTGGLAVGHIKQTLSAVATPGYFASGNTVESQVFEHTKTGWTIGAGAEVPIWDHWSAKLEYLYVDLGHVDDSFTSPVTPAAGFGFVASQTTATSYNIREHIVRLGLNYNFGGGPSGPMAMASAAPPVVNWNGFYGGLNAGGGLAHNPSYEPLRIPGNPFPVWGDDNYTNAPAGAIAGAQLGWNYRFAPSWLAGVEADVQWSGQKNSACVSECIPVAFDGTAGVTPGQLKGLIDEQRIKWFGTARARLGWISPGGTLWYATGGAAFGQIDQTLTMFASQAFFASGTEAAASFSQTRLGWTIGGGVETPIWDKWSVKAEYLYIDLGSITNSYSAALDSSFAPFGDTIVATSQFKVQDHIFRFGLNYHLN